MMMKLSLLLVALAGTVVTTAFQVPDHHTKQPVTSVGPLAMVGGFAPTTMTSSTTTIDVSETAPRDVDTMLNWARQCGVRMIDGVEIGTADGEDYSVYTNAAIGAGNPVLLVPAALVMTSGSVESEFGGALQAAEGTLLEFEGTAQRLPLFRLMIRVLAEYEKGDQSPWYYYLNGMPRRFYNGAAMTGTYFVRWFDCSFDRWLVVLA